MVREKKKKKKKKKIKYLVGGRQIFPFRPPPDMDHNFHVNFNILKNLNTKNI